MSKSNRSLDALVGQKSCEGDDHDFFSKVPVNQEAYFLLVRQLEEMNVKL